MREQPATHLRNLRARSAYIPSGEPYAALVPDRGGHLFQGTSFNPGGRHGSARHSCAVALRTTVGRR